jgi:hypothetical protein
MMHVDPQIEREADPLARPTHIPEEPGRHRVVSRLPPWPPPPVPPELLWRSRFVEYGGLAVAMVCFAAAICAVARAFYLAEEHRLGLWMFALLAALGASFAWLGSRIVQAIATWLEAARALNRARSPRPPDSDPSPRPPPRDSTC